MESVDICSEKCQAIYELENKVVCNKCSMCFYKMEGVNGLGLWFCSESCMGDYNFDKRIMTRELIDIEDEDDLVFV